MIRAAANIEEQVQRLTTNFDPKRQRPEEDAYFRWCTNEWAYCDLGDDFYLLDDDELAAPIPDVVPGAGDVYVDDNDDQLQAEIYAAMVLAMRDLTLSDSSITLLCDTWKRPEQRSWLGLESARLLNPPHVYEKFAADWNAWHGAEGESITRTAQEGPVYRLFKQLLEHQIEE